MKTNALLIAIVLTYTSTAFAQRYTDAEGRVRVALLKQPYSPTGTSVGDEGGLSIAAVNRMIAGAVRGVKIRESRKTNAK